MHQFSTVRTVLQEPTYVTNLPRSQQVNERDRYTDPYGGLNASLTTMKVPGYTAACERGWVRQSAKHVFLYCPQHQERRNKLYQEAGTRNYQKMLVTPRGAKAAANFLQATNLLPQFQRGLH